MTEENKSDLISRRRALSLLGLTTAVAFVVPAVTLAGSEAVAQTAGMERRQQRRMGRQDRRDERRTGRQDRRDTRRGVSQPATTGSTGTSGAK
jgi:hypothetical protein